MLRALVLLVVFAGGCAALRPDFTDVARSEGAAVVAVASGFDEAAGDEEGPLFGSGFIVTSDGYIVTNAHLVEQAPEDVTVRLADRRELKAAVVGSDPVSDIALLKVTGSGLPHVRIGDSRKLQAGEWVAAIGSPFGLEQSVTAGIVSATDRTLPEEGFVPFIQTDVAVNPGNSGGPLFDLHGEVIGVNSVIYSASGGFVGVSFAVPIEVAMDVVRELRAYGHVTHGRIGVRLQELTADLAAALDVPGGQGALLLEILDRSPAQRAGLRPGDVVVRFAGKPVRTPGDLMRLVSGTPPGEKVLTEFVRHSERHLVYVTIEEARPPIAIRRAGARAPGEPLGLLLVPSSEGLAVKHVGGSALRAGLQAGDIVVSVNGEPVLTPAEFQGALAKLARGANVALLVQREGIRRFVAVRLPE